MVNRLSPAFDDNHGNENTMRPYNLYLMTAQPRGTETNTKLEKYFNHTNFFNTRVSSVSCPGAEVEKLSFEKYLNDVIKYLNVVGCWLLDVGCISE